MNIKCFLFSSLNPQNIWKLIVSLLILFSGKFFIKFNTLKVSKNSLFYFIIKTTSKAIIRLDFFTSVHFMKTEIPKQKKKDKLLLIKIFFCAPNLSLTTTTVI